ncbi:MAG TPA: hypothetical protein VN752_05260 [Solirubrobacterales bacterium]|nr:hypothetical protein [Solirubrobacterales bacterium]
MPPLDPSPASFSRFGGLKLDRPVDEIGGEDAIVSLDVDWDVSLEALRPRMGSTLFKDLNKIVDGLFAHSDTFLIARREDGAKDRKLIALNTAAEVKAESAAEEALKGAPMSCTRFGTPAASNTYIGMGEAGIRKFDGAAFSKPTGTVDGVAGKALPLAYHLAAWPEGGNRLVACGTPAAGGPNGAASSRSHVWFSDAGNAESWHTVAPEANYVQLMPGDGENIVGCCAWGGNIFVFKETRMFVFYGVSADNEGAPVFNFRVVDLGTTVLAPPAAAETSDEVCVAGDDAVYFRTLDGIWATTGDEPGLVSEDLSGLSDITGASSSYFAAAMKAEKVTLGAFTDKAQLTYFDRRLHVPCGAMSYVYDARRDGWLAWQSGARSYAPWRSSASTATAKKLFFASGDSIYFYDPTVIADPSLVGVAGTKGETLPIWQAGFYDCGSVDEKTLTHTKLWGSGELSLAVAEDFGSVGKAKTIKFEETASTRQVQMQQTATLFSHRISGKGPWLLHRISRYLRETRVPATQKP